MSKVRSLAGPLPEVHRPRTGHLGVGLHLVLDLDLVLESVKRRDDGICRLENVRSCLPGVTLTLFSDRQGDLAMNLLSGAGLLPPEHLLANSGLVVLHRDAHSHMERDPDYREWLDFQYETRTRPGSAKAIGMEYLEICWATPRPLMVVGRPGPDAPILGLADIPVFSEEAGSQDVQSGLLTCRAFQVGPPVLSGVVRLLLAYLAGGRSFQVGQALQSQAPSPRTGFTKTMNAWRIQPVRLRPQGDEERLS